MSWRSLDMVGEVVKNDRKEQSELRELIDLKTKDNAKYAAVEKGIQSEKYKIEGHESDIKKNEQKIEKETRVAETKPDNAEKALEEIERLKGLIVKSRGYIEKNKQKKEDLEIKLKSIQFGNKSTVEDTMKLARVDRNLELSGAALERVRQKVMHQYVPKRIMPPSENEKRRADFVDFMRTANYSDTTINDLILKMERHPQAYIRPDDSEPDSFEIAAYAQYLLKQRPVSVSVSVSGPSVTSVATVEPVIPPTSTSKKPASRLPEVEEKKRQLIRFLTEANWHEKEIASWVAKIEHNPRLFLEVDDSDSDGYQMAEYARVLLKSATPTPRPESTPTPRPVHLIDQIASATVLGGTKRRKQKSKTKKRR